MHARSCLFRFVPFPFPFPFPPFLFFVPVPTYARNLICRFISLLMETNDIFAHWGRGRENHVEMSERDGNRHHLHICTLHWMNSQLRFEIVFFGGFFYILNFRIWNVNSGRASHDSDRFFSSFPSFFFAMGLRSFAYPICFHELWQLINPPPPQFYY